MILTRAAKAGARLTAFAETRPEYAPVVRAAVEIVDVVLAEARAEIEAAKAETAQAIAKSAASTAAFQKTVEARDEAEIKVANLTIENSALRIKSLAIEREQATKRHEIRKAAVAEQDAVEKAEVQAAIATQLTLVYLQKRSRHVVTDKSFIDSPRKMSGPWELDTPQGETILCETRADVVAAAQEIAVAACKSVPSEDDPLNNPSDKPKRPLKYPEVGADMGSNDTYDAKAKSERVPVAKRASGKRKPKWAR